MERGAWRAEDDSGWVGAGPEDDLEARLAAEEAAAAVDLARPHVMTLLGPVEPGALGVTLVARSLWASEATAGDERYGALAGLEDWFAVGGRAVLAVDGGGADPEALGWLAARAPVHLVASGRSPWTGPGGDPIGVAIRDLTRDPETGRESRSDTARTAATVGAAVPWLVVGEGSAVVAAVERFVGGGAGGGRVIGYESGGRGGVAGDTTRRLLAAGAFAVVAADGEAGEGAGWAASAARIAGLVREGFGDRIMLGVEAAAGKMGAAGVPVWSELLERLPVALMAAGLDAPAVRRLLIENPAAALTIGGNEGRVEGA